MVLASFITRGNLTVIAKKATFIGINDSLGGRYGERVKLMVCHDAYIETNM